MTTRTHDPPGWCTKQLGDVATLQRGYDLPSRLRRDGSIPIVTSSGITDRHADAKVKGPGVVTGRYGTIGSVYFVEPDFWPLNTTLYVSDFHGNDSRFIFHFLQTIDYASHSGKSGVPGINRNDLHVLDVTIPGDLGEQRAIATALTDVDAQISSLEHLVRKNVNIKHGVMQQLLTGRTRLPSFTEPWTDVELSRIATIKTGSRNNQDKKPGGRYPFFVRSQTVERIDSYSHDGEAILVPGEGRIGSIFHYINGRFDVHQRVYKVSNFATNYSGLFVYYYMMQFFGEHALRNSVKATVDSLRLPTFKDFVVHGPTSPDEQAAIAKVLESFDEKIDALKLRLAKTIDVKQGMMQQLLTGRVRLVSDEVSA